MKGIFYTYTCNIFVVAMLLFTFMSCKSTEDIRREKMLDDISSKVGQSDVRLSESGKLLSNHSIKLSELESLINKNTGAVEDLKYRLTQEERKSDEKLSMLSKRMEEFFSIVEEQKQKNLLLDKAVNDQKQYIEDVLAALDKIKEILKEEGKERGKKPSKKERASNSNKDKDKDKDKEKNKDNSNNG